MEIAASPVFYDTSQNIRMTTIRRAGVSCFQDNNPRKREEPSSSSERGDPISERHSFELYSWPQLWFLGYLMLDYLEKWYLSRLPLSSTILCPLLSSCRLCLQLTFQNTVPNSPDLTLLLDGVLFCFLSVFTVDTTVFTMQIILHHLNSIEILLQN